MRCTWGLVARNVQSRRLLRKRWWSWRRRWKTYSIVERLAAVLKAIPNPIRLEGHTDAVPIHTARFQSNWELSAARGISMLRLLTEKFGIQTERCAVVGYAETAPVVSNDSEEGRGQNRRVDVVIVSKLALQATAPAKKPPPAH
ncbi:MAG: OmpA family protein [Acidobacteria bacterium]|nr:OmpA family protein [Acidobacteriota bacterium]